MYLEKSFIIVTKNLEPPTEGTPIGQQTSLWISSSNPVVTALLGKGWRCCLPIAHPSQFRSTASWGSKFSPLTRWPYRGIIWVAPDCSFFLYSESRQERLCSVCKACHALWPMAYCFPSMVISHNLSLNLTATSFFVIDGREKNLFWSFGTKAHP